MIPKAYSYLRFSTPEQSSGDSSRRQSTAAIEWCERKGIELDQTLTFQDLGRSGFTGANFLEGALGAFFDAVEAGIIEKGSYLVIEALDRFSRENPMAAADRLFRLVRLGITLVTTDDGQEYSAERLSGTDPSAMLLLVVKMTQAHLESVRKSELVGKAWRQKKALAREERRPLTKRCPEWLDLVDGRFVPNERVKVVHRIFQMTIDGCGRREIVRRLNAEDVPTFRSDENRKKARELGISGWQTSSVAKLIQNQAVLGFYQPHSGTHKRRNRVADGDPIASYYPAIIDEQMFWEAQSAVEGRRHGSSGRRGNGGSHILRGLAKCAACGGPMHIQNKGAGPKGGVYLICSSSPRSAGCSNSRRWRVDRLEPALLQALGFVDAGAFASFDDATPAAVAAVAAARAKLSAAKVRRKRWSDILDDPEADDENAQERYSAAAADVRSAQRELQAAEDEASKLAADPGLVTRLTDAVALSHQLDEANDERRRALRIRLSEVLKRLVDRVVCDEDIGASMVLKPRLSVRLDGYMPFPFRMSGGVVEMLIERDVPETIASRFIGMSDFG